MAFSLPPSDPNEYYPPWQEFTLVPVTCDSSFPTITYACTWQPHLCTSLFPSYALWTAHEVSHGPIPHAYFCSIRIFDNGQRCMTAYPSPEALIAHLQQDHNQQTALPMEKYTDPKGSYVVHQDGTTSWCGFCRTVMKANVVGVQAFENLRFQHLQGHFMGRGTPKVEMGSWDNIYRDF